MLGMFEGIVGGGLAVILVNSKFAETQPIWLRAVCITIVWFILFSLIEVSFRQSSITTFWDTILRVALWIYLPLILFMYFFKWVDKLRKKHKEDS
ncbi:hypothetical protein Kkor_2474 [Kangiella koreensis DSM 16069]|uniref:Transmembrane protein n=2 Tax=Kangiella TaxID=261963 RepID=C7R993_KANKD|nr:hypothetical protein Kkor_2474 [Kangiella koreensis DSM 16069]